MRASLPYAHSRHSTRMTPCARRCLLSHNASDIAERLAVEVQERLRKPASGLEARITHLAYAPESRAPCCRASGQCIIAAREKIVEGAVSMVDMALS